MADRCANRWKLAALGALLEALSSPLRLARETAALGLEIFGELSIPSRSQPTGRIESGHRSFCIANFGKHWSLEAFEAIDLGGRICRPRAQAGRDRGALARFDNARASEVLRERSSPKIGKPVKRLKGLSAIGIGVTIKPLDY